MNKSVRAFFLTILLSAAGCFMQVHAEESIVRDCITSESYAKLFDQNDPNGERIAICSRYHCVDLDNKTIVSSGHLQWEKSFQISLSSDPGLHSFAVWVSKPYDNCSYDSNSNDLVMYDPTQLDLANGNEVDSSILKFIPSEDPSCLPSFVAVAPGTVMLTFVGDVIVDWGPFSYWTWTYPHPKKQHVIVDVPVTVIE